MVYLLKTMIFYSYISHYQRSGEKNGNFWGKWKTPVPMDDQTMFPWLKWPLRGYFVFIYIYIYIYISCNYIYIYSICVCMCIYIYNNHIIMCPIFRHIEIHFKKNSEEPRGRCGQPKDSSPADFLAPSFSSSGPLVLTFAQNSRAVLPYVTSAK